MSERQTRTSALIQWWAANLNLYIHAKKQLTKWHGIAPGALRILLVAWAAIHYRCCANRSTHLGHVAILRQGVWGIQVTSNAQRGLSLGIYDRSIWDTSCFCAWWYPNQITAKPPRPPKPKPQPHPELHLIITTTIPLFLSFHLSPSTSPQ